MDQLSTYGRFSPRLDQPGWLGWYRYQLGFLDKIYYALTNTRFNCRLTRSKRATLTWGPSASSRRCAPFLPVSFYIPAACSLALSLFCHVCRYEVFAWGVHRQGDQEGGRVAGVEREGLLRERECWGKRGIVDACVEREGLLTWGASASSRRSAPHPKPQPPSQDEICRVHQIICPFISLLTNPAGNPKILGSPAGLVDSDSDPRERLPGQRRLLSGTHQSLDC